MILPVHTAVRAALSDTLTTRFSIAPADQPAIVIDVPPSRALGDLAIPIAFELARRLRHPPGPSHDRSPRPSVRLPASVVWRRRRTATSTSFSTGRR